MRAWPCGALVAGWLLAGAAGSRACELPPDPRADGAALFTIDPRESQIQFDADAGWHRFEGTVGKVSGRFRVVPDAPEQAAAACIDVEAASITTGIGMRDERMRERHLEADRYPTIRFDLMGLDGVRPLGQGRYTGTVRGTLTMRGVSSPLAAPVEARVDAAGVSVQGKVPVRLSTFGIVAPSVLFVTMKDEVLVRFRLQAPRSGG